MLARVGVGSPTESDIEAFKTRFIKSESCSLKEASEYYCKTVYRKDSGAICLLLTNVKVEEFNKLMLKSEEIEMVNVNAEDTHQDGEQKKKTAKKLKTTAECRKKASDTAGLEEILTVGVNARVMLRDCQQIMRRKFEQVGLFLYGKTYFTSDDCNVALL
uniref:Uncharacterized protein n=1 Tax=Romanomermis culicivorax TaxID=13658 RepID=A0A915I0U3_ROMCU